MKNLLTAVIVLFSAYIHTIPPKKATLTLQETLYQPLMYRFAKSDIRQHTLIPQIHAFLVETENLLSQILNNTTISAATRIEQALKAYGLFNVIMRHTKELPFYSKLDTIHTSAFKIQQLIDDIQTRVEQELAYEEAARQEHAARRAGTIEASQPIDDQPQIAEAAPAIPEVPSLEPIHPIRAHTLRAELEFILRRAPITRDKHTLQSWSATLAAFEKELEMYEDHGGLGFMLYRAKEAVQMRYVCL